MRKSSAMSPVATAVTSVALPSGGEVFAATPPGAGAGTLTGLSNPAGGGTTSTLGANRTHFAGPEPVQETVPALPPVSLPVLAEVGSIVPLYVPAEPLPSAFGGQVTVTLIRSPESEPLIDPVFPV